MLGQNVPSRAENLVATPFNKLPTLFRLTPPTVNRTSYRSVLTNTQEMLLQLVINSVM